MKCDLCGSNTSLPLFDLARNNESIANVVCCQCGLVYINQQTRSEEELKQHYSDGTFSLQARGSKYPSNSKRRQSEHMAIQRFRILSSAIDLKNYRGKLLEIGCGLGSFMRLMKGAGWETMGLEPDKAYAELGVEWYGLSIRASFYEDVEWQVGSFDMIAAFHVLEHVISPRRILRKVRQELRPGGILYLEVPCIERPYGGNLREFFWSEHLYTFSKNTLTGLLALTGFEVMQTGYTGNFLWVLAKSRNVVEATSKTQALFPLDVPSEVIEHTKRTYRDYRSRERYSARPRVIKRASHISARAVRKVWYEPDDVVPAVVRKLKPQLLNLSGRFGFDTASNDEKYIAHFGLHAPGNAGDTLLFVATRKLFDDVIGWQKWSLEPLWKTVTAQTIERINRESKGVLIGGGGLLLRDTNANLNSGWQWNCSVELLRRLDVPIVVFGIGYNRFREQDDFDSVFREHIQETVRLSQFFGLRNHGSIRQLSEYLDNTLTSKLRFQPCPTTLLHYLYPESHPARDNSADFRSIALNTAFDRWELRFGQQEDEILTSLAKVMKWVNEQGWKVKLAVHSQGDETVIPWLLKENVDFQEHNLCGVPYEEIIDFYSSVSLAIGMRGHSQLIPFGLGVPIISVISHDKLGYFLEDINCPDWGIDVHAREFRDGLIDMIKIIGRDSNLVHQRLVQARNALWEQTVSNLEGIASSFTQ